MAKELTKKEQIATLKRENNRLQSQKSALLCFVKAIRKDIDRMGIAHIEKTCDQIIQQAESN